MEEGLRRSRRLAAKRDNNQVNTDNKRPRDDDTVQLPLKKRRVVESVQPVEPALPEEPVPVEAETSSKRSRDDPTERLPLKKRRVVESTLPEDPVVAVSVEEVPAEEVAQPNVESTVDVAAQGEAEEDQDEDIFEFSAVRWVEDEEEDEIQAPLVVEVEPEGPVIAEDYRVDNYLVEEDEILAPPVVQPMVQIEERDYFEEEFGFKLEDFALVQCNLCFNDVREREMMNFKCHSTHAICGDCFDAYMHSRSKAGLRLNCCPFCRGPIWEYP